MLFDSWTGLGRVLLVGPIAYISLIAFLRVSGKRTLTKLNAFDLVITVALGSTLATILLSESVALAEGLLALGLLILSQFAITWLSVRVPWVDHTIKSEPTLLAFRGQFLDQSMRAQRVTREEIMAVLRGQGHARLDDDLAVVLETDGSLSVVSDAADTSAAQIVDRPDEPQSPSA